MTSYPVTQGAMRSRVQVAALDFGTTFSGYAFSFRSDFERDPLSVQTHSWNSGSGRQTSLKTASCILFAPNKTFHSFGFEAEDFYAELAGSEEHKNWFFFRRFKMLLYENKKLNRKSKIRDENGNEMLAMTVFSECIQYLKNHMLERGKEKSYGLHPSEIHWVLTVPAIWNDPAKQFMREAAVQAGIPSESLSLALEPEAASLFCKHLPVNMIQGAEGTGLSCFGPGTKYLVLDCGGGTVDITVHETQRDHTVRELFKANGGPWGGTSVDAAFRKFLDDVTGDGTMKAFERDHQEDFVDLFREFEIKKRSFRHDLQDKVTFKIPLSMHEAYRTVNECDFRQSLIQRQEVKDQVTFTGDKLRVKSEQVMRFFTETCENIIGHLRMVLAESAVRGTNTILMVGGFSESEILQHMIRAAFPDMRIVIPAEAGLAVLKGAVIFGHNPNVIVARVAKYTYGVEVIRPFREGVDPPTRRVIIDGEQMLDGCFDKHVEEGETVEVGQEFGSKSYVPSSRTQTQVALNVYTSHGRNPTYVDDRGCTRLGTLTVNVGHIARYNDRSMTVKMQYGNTELGVEAVLDSTGQKLTANFDFLG